MQLERVAAAASQIPRPSSKCTGCSHCLGHLWARPSGSCRGHHCHSLWQIWVSLPSRCFPKIFCILTSSFRTPVHQLYFLPFCSMFRQGMHDLKVWPGVEGDGGEPTTTPGRTSSSLTEDQMGRLAKVEYLCGQSRIAED